MHSPNGHGCILAAPCKGECHRTWLPPYAKSPFDMQTALLISCFSVVEYLLPCNEYGIRPCGAVPQPYATPLGVCAVPPRDRTVVFCMSSVRSLMRIAAAKCGRTYRLTRPNRVSHILCMPPWVSSVSSKNSMQPCTKDNHAAAYPFLDSNAVGNKVPLYVAGVGLASVLSFAIMWGISRLRDWLRPTARGIPPSMSDKTVEDGEKLCITISKESTTKVWPV